MFCEKCKNEHNGLYGSGRFCGATCARSFATSFHRDLINGKRSLALKGKPSNGRGWVAVRTPEVRKKAILTMQKNRMMLPFEKLGNEYKRIRILEEQENKCLICKIPPIWNEKKLVFHLDHIDGNKHDESRENLRLLCPNCHSQTPTWCSKNSKAFKEKKSAANGT